MSRDVVIRAGSLAIDGRLTGPKYVRVDRGTIVEIGEAGRDGGEPETTARAMIVSAGLLDIHTHGAAGWEVVGGDASDIAGMARFYASHGVTGFLATIGGSRENIEAGIDAVRQYLREPVPGARCLGIHVEGPFLNPACPGAFHPATILPPDAALLQEWQERACGAIRLITLAPEVPGMAAVLGAARRLGICCSAGHSAASAQQLDAAVSAGVRSVTHLFNAMQPMHHREPGLVGAALTDDRLTTELIADGVHVDPILLRLTYRAKGVERIALVTDSIGATGIADGEYCFEERPVLVRDGQVRLRDGTLAGSTTTMDQAVRTFARATGVRWCRAVTCATATPARLIGLGDRYGTIRVGAAADLIGVDARGGIEWTMVGGELVHVR